MLDATQHQKIRMAGLSLFLIFIGIYSLSYLGVWLGTDELHMFDSIESLVRRGNLDVTIQYVTNFTPEKIGDNIGAPSRYEPVQMILAAPFYYAASIIPSVGMMHSVWFVNVIITALIVVTLYWIALTQGYSWQVAWIGSAMYGVGTQALPYSRWFYRDPLSALTIILCFGLVIKIKKNIAEKESYWKWGLVFAVSYFLAFFSKQVVLLILPSIFILFFDTRILGNRRILISFISISSVAGIALALIFLLNLSSSRQLGFLDDIDWRISWLFESEMGYMVSPSRSVWLYSPILILMLPGSLLLWQKAHSRFVVSIWVSFLTFALSYGFRHTWNWWGSWSWGPRYLLPILPMLMLLVFPVLEWIEQSRRKIIWRSGLLGLLAISVWVQLIGMGVSYSNYYTERHHAGAFIGKKSDKRWDYYNWDWDRAPFAYHLKHWDWNHLWTWQISDPAWLVPLLSVFTIGIGLALLFWQGKSMSKFKLVSAGLASLILPILLWGTILYSLQDDPRYTYNPELSEVRQLIDELNATTTEDDVIFLERLSDMVLFMNYAKNYSWLITLPSAPGEQYGDIQPQIVSDNLYEQAGFRNVYALDWLSKREKTAWLVTTYSPFHTQQLRPIEHIMAQNYYPISEIYVTENARAVRYLLEPTPIAGSTNDTEFKFGEHLELASYDITDDIFESGDVIPLSLLWRVNEALSLDYNVGVFVLTANGQVVADRNGVPQGTFGKMSQWEVDKFYRDNHGLALPEDLPAGDYTIEVIIYYWQDLQNLPVTFDGEAIGERAVLTTIQVR